MEYEHLTPAQEADLIDERLPDLERQHAALQLDYESNGTDLASQRMQESEAKILGLRERRDALRAQAA